MESEVEKGGEPAKQGWWPWVWGRPCFYRHGTAHSLLHVLHRPHRAAMRRRGMEGRGRPDPKTALP